MAGRWRLVGAAALAWLAFGLAPLAAQEAKQAAGANGGKEPAAKERAAQAGRKAPPQIEQRIKDLDDDRFQVRETATSELMKAGREAVEPLTKAAAEGGLEVTVRAIHILTQLGVSTDGATAEAARLALEGLAEGRAVAPRERAAAALESLDALEVDRATQRLKDFGAFFGTGRFVGGEETVSYHMVVPKKWSGGNDGIRLLRFLRDVNYVSVYGGKINDDAVPHLQKLKHLQRLELYGTEISEKGFEKVKSALQGVDVDVRGGGLLGVQGQPDAPGCMITVVRPGQAAAEAKLEPGDVIVKADDKEIDNFNKLLEYIRPKRAGTKVKLVVRRGETTFEREVTLSAWGDDEPKPVEKR
jgi:hypothetical protein